MRRLLRVGLLLALLASLESFAQGKKPPPKLEPLPEPPPPPPMPADEAPVTIVPRTEEGDKVEAVREGGRVVMLKVTPKNGKPYYLVDTTGNGNWMRRDSLDDGVRVPMWPIHTWD